MDSIWQFLDVFTSSFKDSKMTLGLSFGVIFTIYKLKEFLDERNYLKRNNIPSSEFSMKIIEFFKQILKGMARYDQELMQKNGKIFGFYSSSRLTIFTTDLKLIKTITIKDFNYFVNRNQGLASLLNKPFDKMMSILADEEWKTVRTLSTPTFTSGKLKSMTRTITKCSENFENFLADLVEKDGILDTKIYYGGYSLDVISSCCFGVDTNSIKDPNNEFIKNLRKLTTRSTFTIIKILFIILFPKFFITLNRITNTSMFSFFPKDSSQFIQNISNQIIQNRKNGIEKRDDFIQSMIAHEETAITSSDKKSKSLTDAEILSQAVTFLIAGYDTVFNALSFVTYCLATNPEHQQTLCEEIDTILEKHDGEINYEAVGEMKFLDMVIDETLRMYPAILRVDREATSDYEYNGMKIKKGSLIIIPIYTIHHDPDIYPDPEKFDPYRFDEDNKKTRDSSAHLQFGLGPRNCIGMRFALLEMKLLLVRILSKYKFVRCAETQVPLVLQKSFDVRPAQPIKVKLEKRF